jgi:hypothetical protein
LQSNFAWGKQEAKLWSVCSKGEFSMANKTSGDIFEREKAEKLLYPAKGLPGGGQLEVRMEISPDHPDPDIRGVARREIFQSGKLAQRVDGSRKEK